MMAGFGDEILILRGPTGLTDQSATGATATYYGGMGTTADTGRGGTDAFLLDGTDDYIETSAISAANVGTGDITVAAFVNFDITTGTRVVFRANYSSGAGSASNRGAGIFLQSNLLNFHYRTNTGGFIGVSETPPSTTIWKLLSVVRRAQVVETWIDGVMVGSTAGASAAYSGHVHFRFGSDTLSAANFLDGKIDDIRVFDKAVSGADLLAWSNAGRGYDVATGTIQTRRRRDLGGFGL